MMQDERRHGQWWDILPGQLMPGETLDSGHDDADTAIASAKDVSWRYTTDVRLQKTIECDHEFDAGAPPPDAFESVRWCVMTSKTVYAL